MPRPAPRSALAVAALAVAPLALVLAACDRSAPPPDASAAHAGPSAPPASAAPSASPAASAAGPAAAADAAPPGPAPHADAYPVGKACATAAALAREHRTLPPRAAWSTVAHPGLGLRVRVPEGAFPEIRKERDALVLRGKDRAAGLGPGAKDHVFAVTLRRPATRAAELAATAPRPLLPGRELAFPRGTLASFAAHEEEPVVSGAAFPTRLAGHPAWVWVNGVEGYDEDVALVDLGADGAVVAVATWNTAIMAGQAECWQRQVIGGVLESLELDPRP